MDHLPIEGVEHHDRLSSEVLVIDRIPPSREQSSDQRVVAHEEGQVVGFTGKLHDQAADDLLPVPQRRLAAQQGDPESQQAVGVFSHRCPRAVRWVRRGAFIDAGRQVVGELRPQMPRPVQHREGRFQAINRQLRPRPVVESQRGSGRMRFWTAEGGPARVRFRVLEELSDDRVPPILEADLIALQVLLDEEAGGPFAPGNEGCAGDHERRQDEAKPRR